MHPMFFGSQLDGSGMGTGTSSKYQDHKQHAQCESQHPCMVQDDPTYCGDSVVILC